MAHVQAVDPSENAPSDWRSTADSLHRRFSQWTVASWHQLIVDDEMSRDRADVVFEAIEQLAAMTATYENQPSRRVPKLQSPLALPDQFAVIVDDLTRATGPQGTREAVAVLLGLARACGFPTPHEPGMK